MMILLFLIRPRTIFYILLALGVAMALAPSHPVTYAVPAIP